MRILLGLFISFFQLIVLGAVCDARVIDIDNSRGLACVVQKIDGIMNISLRVRLIKDQDLDTIAALYTNSPSNTGKILEFNKKIGTDASVFRFVPYHLLKPEYKRVIIEKVFPDDRPVKEGWSHKVTYVRSFAGYETLFRIAFWFTGSGFNAERLMNFNGISDEIKKDQIIIIPGDLLLDVFKGEKVSAKDRCNSSSVSDEDKNGELIFKKDEEGEYAAYRLKKDEALYTSVVIRFTGQIRHDDVMKTAEEIRRRSGIKDVTDIPIGYEIKIPLSLLLPEYLPEDDARRIEYEKHQEYLASVRNPVKARNLSGIHVILDPGHGGTDPGAIGYYKMPEDEYAYDVACRIRDILKSETQAEVHMTITDKKTGFSIINEKRLEDNKDEVLNTTPPYNLDDSRTAVNLRCYLVNSIFQRLVKSGVEPEKIVFTSFHFDARYRDSRGVMIYIPGSGMRKPYLEVNGGCYNRFYEYRRSPKITFSSLDMRRYEGYSKTFANTLISSFRSRNLVVSNMKPVRDRIFRGRKILLPAVLRYSLVPTSVLIEVANFKNRKDCRTIKRDKYRQEIAEAYVHALQEYYDNKM